MEFTGDNNPAIGEISEQDHLAGSFEVDDFTDTPPYDVYARGTEAAELAGHVIVPESLPGIDYLAGESADEQLTKGYEHNRLQGIDPPRYDGVHAKQLTEAINRSHRTYRKGMLIPEFSEVDRQQWQLQTDQDGIAFVDMNCSGRLLLRDDEHGYVATEALAGCTGVAGFIHGADGRTEQFVSHYDPPAQMAEYTGLETPIVDHMRNFLPGGTDGPDQNTPAYYVVAYYMVAHREEDFGAREGDFKNWHYVDQIRHTVSHLGTNARVLFLPYDYDSHSLAAGRDEAGEGIYWDGVRVDFDDPASIMGVEGAVLMRGGSRV